MNERDKTILVQRHYERRLEKHDILMRIQSIGKDDQEMELLYFIFSSSSMRSQQRHNEIW